MLYIKTEAGKTELQARAAGLSPSQRQVLILCDGERHAQDLADMMPQDVLNSSLERLVNLRLLEARNVPAPQRAVVVELDEAERYRVMVELATSLAVDLGFTARIRAQLQIEKANTPADLTDVVGLLCKHLTDKHRDPPLMALRLNKLRQLAAA